MGFFYSFVFPIISHLLPQGLPRENTLKATTVPLVPNVRFHESAGWWASPHSTYILSLAQKAKPVGWSHTTPQMTGQGTDIPLLDYLLPIHSLVFVQLSLAHKHTQEISNIVAVEVQSFTGYIYSSYFVCQSHPFTQLYDLRSLQFTLNFSIDGSEFVYATLYLNRGFIWYPIDILRSYPITP